MDSGFALWMWPWTAAKLASDWAETLTSAAQVIEKRMPVMIGALSNPMAADHRELSRMVSEKVDAFGASQRSLGAATDKLRRVSHANSRALAQVATGTFGFYDWSRLFERNLEIMSTLAMLPTASLAPVHVAATANNRRLT